MSAPPPADLAPIPSIVVRDGVVRDANQAVLDVLGLSRDELVGRPFAAFLAPGEVQPILERAARRARGEAAPTVYQAHVVVGDVEKTFQVHVARRGADLVAQLVDVTAEAKRRASLMELARVGAVLQRLHRDEDVWRAARDALAGAGLESLELRPRGGGLEVVDDRALAGDRSAEEAPGGLAVGLRCRWSPFAQDAWRDGAAFADDWLQEARLLAGDGPSPRAGAPAAAGVRVDVQGAGAVVLIALGEWLRREDLPALQLLAAQVSAALDAARAFEALSRRNRELDALNRVAQGAATAPDLRTFLADQAPEVVAAVGGAAAVVRLVDREGREARVLHVHGNDEALRARLAAAPLDETPLGMVALDGIARVRQLDGAPEATQGDLPALGLATVVAVPLRFRSTIVGVLSVGFREHRAPHTCGAELLQAMGVHFAAAIETHRLLGDLRGRVAELTLLNDISVATTTLDPVELLENALRRIAATFVAETAAAYVADGADLVQVAALGLSAEAAVETARLSAGEGPSGVAYARRKTIDAATLPAAADPETSILRAEGVRAAAGVPLLAKEHAVGAFALGRKRDEPFADAELALLSILGVQLGVALENARLFADTRRRVADLEAVNSLALRVFGTAPGDRAGLLAATCKEIAGALSARAAVVLELDGSGERLEGVAGWGTPVPPAQLTVSLARSELAARALRTQEPVWGLELPEVGARVPRQPPLSFLLVPLTSRGATRGLVAIGDAPARRYGDAEIALAYALASEAAVGLENAALFAEARSSAEELRRSYVHLARAQTQLVGQERLAALGELAAVVAHEVRNPLGVIFNSLGSLRRLVSGEGDARMLLDIVGEEADRLNRIVGDLLDFARPTTPALRPEPLRRVLDDALAAAFADAGRRVLLVREIAEDLPCVPMDVRLMRQALLNLTLNAVQAMPEGGTLTVRAAVADGAARVEISDTGPGIEEAVRDRMFEPFFTTKPSGSGLGLAVVKRIVDDHRGRLEVRSAPGEGTTFVVCLPLEVGRSVENGPGME